MFNIRKKDNKKILVNIKPLDAFNLINDNIDNPNFIVIDVRTPEEFNEIHIENAKLLDYFSDNFLKKLDEMNKNKKYLIYCRKGHRSIKTLKIMKNLEFKEVYNLLGGITSWIAGGLPAIK
jgi:rhodanese-related sulfurtransferase